MYILMLLKVTKPPELPGDLFNSPNVFRFHTWSQQAPWYRGGMGDAWGGAIPILGVHIDHVTGLGQSECPHMEWDTGGSNALLCDFHDPFHTPLHYIPPFHAPSKSSLIG